MRVLKSTKSLKKYLTEELGIPETPNNPKGVFKLANENDLFAVPLEQWLDYADARIGTSHDYDGQKAQACLALVPAFIDDAIGLYQTITSATWD